MTDGREALRAELDAFHEALRVFEDPVVDEFLGLRLMRATLGERRDAIAAKVDDVEQTTLRVGFGGSVAKDRALPVDVAVDVLQGIDGALRALTLTRTRDWAVPLTEQTVHDAVGMRISDVEADSGFTMVLQRPAGPLEAQPIDPDTGQLLVEVVIDTLLDIMEAAELSTELPPPAADVAAALSGCAHRCVQASIELSFTTAPARTGERSVMLSRPGAQRLAAALAQA